MSYFYLQFHGPLIPGDPRIVYRFGNITLNLCWIYFFIYIFLIFFIVWGHVIILYVGMS